MKKSVLIALVAAQSAFIAGAQQTVKTLWSGDPVEVTWENTLTINADEFQSDDVAVGNYIHIEFSKTTDVIELKADGTWLPGTRKVELGDNSTKCDTYITVDMLAKLREFGVEICGASFTVSSVSICSDGFNMPEGAIWGGYFWVDNWNTLELFKTAFDNYNGERYMDVYLSDDNGENTAYYMKVLTEWDNTDAIWADNNAITHEARKATVDLKDINVKEKLADVNTLMIQSNPEGGAPYNITAIALRNANGTTAIESVGTDDNADTTADLYNLQGILVKKNVPLNEPISGIPAGLYIANGKKIVVR